MVTALQENGIATHVQFISRVLTKLFSTKVHLGSMLLYEQVVKVLCST